MFASYSFSPMEIPGYITCVIFTYGCKGICDFCYNTELWKCNNPEETVNPEEILKDIDYYNRKYRLITAVSITGAEPLTICDELSEFLIDLKNRDLYINLDTSLTQGKIDKILFMLDKVSLSVKEAWDDYQEDVMYNLKKLEENHTKVEVRIVFTKSNIHKIVRHFEEMITVFDIDIAKVRVSPAVVTSKNKYRFHPLSVHEFQKTAKNFKEQYGDRYDIYIEEE